MVKPLGRNRGAWAYATTDPRRQLARAARWRWAKTHRTQACIAVWPPVLSLLTTLGVVALNLVMPAQGIWLAITLPGSLLCICMLAATTWFNGYMHGHSAGVPTGARRARIHDRWMKSPLARITFSLRCANRELDKGMTQAAEAVADSMRRARLEVPPLKRK